MSFYPQTFLANDTSFHPLFRLLDDFDAYSRGGNQSPRHHRGGGQLKTFTPKFDVQELEGYYELHGELPGIEQKDIEIEFTDAQTLTVKGRTERTYQAGTPPAGHIEGPAATGGAITEGGEHGKGGKQSSHRATVEDEDGEQQSSASTEVTKAADGAASAKPQNAAKYWVSERSVGEFSRSFSFPVRVDQDQVKASMKNGILSILVPKAKRHESRKITIS